MGCLLHFLGRKRQKCAFWCVYIHHSFPLEYNVYSFIWSSVILKKKKNFMASQSGMVFVFNPLWERPASICTGAVTSTVDSLSDVWQFKKKKKKNTLLKLRLHLVLSATMETSQDMTRIIFVQKSAVFWNSYYLVSKSNVKYCQLYKYEHMSFVTLSKSCTFSGGLMYISRC